MYENIAFKSMQVAPNRFLNVKATVLNDDKSIVNFFIDYKFTSICMYKKFYYTIEFIPGFYSLLKYLKFMIDYKFYSFKKGHLCVHSYDDFNKIYERPDAMWDYELISLLPKLNYNIINATFYHPWFKKKINTLNGI